MDETLYTLVRQAGDSWLAHAEDGHPVLLLRDPGLPDDFPLHPGGHAVLAPLEGRAEIDGERWLAYGWGAGASLAERLAAGALPRLQAARLALRLLDGLAHARLVGWRIGLIAAERVLLGADGQPLLAARLPDDAVGEDPVRGIGELLYQMLTARLPLANERGEVALPSAFADGLDPRLEGIVLGALGEAGFPRYGHPLDLRAALADYLAEMEALSTAAQQDDSPAGLLLGRMGKTDDFPALSRAVGAISRVAAADSEKLQALATVILRDFSLTNKVLRLANSASYGQFGGTISTISRAVMVLGFDTIKALTLTLVLIERLSDHALADELKDEVARAFFASVIARQLAERTGYRDLEEARVAGMFHRLGRLLALYYFHDESREIARLIEAGETEERAIRSQLGASYEELGMAVARSWHLPDKLVGSMALEDAKPRSPRHDGDWLRLYANAGSALMRAMLAEDEGQRFASFLRVRDGHAVAMRLTERDLRLAVDEAARETLREAAIFGLETQSEGTLARLRKLGGLPRGGMAAAESGLEEPAPAEEEAAPAVDRPEVVEVLASCVQDVTETLVGDFRLNDLLRMILETLYRSLGVRRVLLATRSVQRNAVVGRFGFGDDIESFLERFQLPLDDSGDLFRTALSRNRDELVDDIDHPAVRERIPAWFRQLGAGRSFLLLPVVIDRKVVGLFYADQDAPGSLRLGPKELGLCKALRNQAVLAIRHKTPPVAGA
ncbi:HDOD domain-containing protein [Chitinimonas koreensis]|uniref:HDOD domain-containing protein n=1 Tax=Chitinimonas koreensis TaxID=356302 RepID=UPI0003FA2131|nr:HDOD domain-containing protein [Chitinimonas koreensis]QNM94736.1 HDOD domain-containing protein [Chitinimonas koreensis]